MKKPTLQLLSTFFKYGLLAISSLYFVIYLIIAFYRIQYPFELEWMEGGSVDHVIRILSGQKLYIKPSIDFIPYVYTPLYYYLSAAVSTIVGIGFLPLRLVSFLSSLGCFLLIFFIVKKETANTIYGLLASSLFAATFRAAGAWLDIARVDSLFLFILLASFYVIKFKNSPTFDVLAGVLMALAFLSKQTALVISLPIMIYLLITRGRHSIFFIGTYCLIIVGSTLLLNYMHDGWYNYYIFYVPKFNGIIKDAFVSFWMQDIFAPLTIASIMSILFIMFNPSRNSFLFYLLAAAGMLLGSWIPRLREGGYNNVLLPAYAIISILFGLSLHAIFGFIRDLPFSHRSRLEIYIYLICIIQFFLLKYNPFALIPTEKDLRAGKLFINKMSQIEGDIYVIGHAYLAKLAGKKSYAHQMIVGDVMRDSHNSFKDEIKKALRDKRFKAIIIDDWFPEIDELKKYYTKSEKVFDQEDVFWPVTGDRRKRPAFIYVPKE